MAKPESKYTISLQTTLTKDGADEPAMYDSGVMKWQGLNYAGAVTMQGELIEVLQQLNNWGEVLAASLSPEQAQQIEVIKGVRAKRERRNPKKPR